MTTTASQADHWFCLLVVPLGWAGCSLLHFQNPGDEYGMYFVSSFAGSWIFLLVPAGDIHNPLISLSVAAVGWLVMAGTGGLLAWLGVRKTLWAGLFVCSALVIFLFMLFSFPTVEAALSKNGSWWAYSCSATELGLYCATAISLLATALTRSWWRKPAEPHPE